MNKYHFEKLKVDYDIPNEVQEDIDRLVDWLNDEQRTETEILYLDDCLRTELNCDLNWCLRERILPEQCIRELKEYYVYQGIKDAAGVKWPKKQCS